MIKIGTVFSGIGSVEHALKRMRLEHQIIFACDNGDVDICEDDLNEKLQFISKKDYINRKKVVDDEYAKSRKTNFVKKTYFANYEIAEDDYHLNIKYLNGNQYKEQIDLFVGGSPCQSFSTMGYQKGLEDSRGTLFYEFARLVKEIKPKVFIYENVQGLLHHDKGNTWVIISEIFKSLGYYYKFQILNSKDYDIPQNRNRLFVVGFREKKYYDKFNFPKKNELNSTLQDYLIEYCKEGHFSFDKKINFPGKVEKKYFLSDKVTKHVLSVGTKNYVTVPKTDLKIARPLLATMHKMHRAAVDNYITIDGNLRRLTPRECLRLMGFEDNFVQVVSDTQMYHQAGNSIVVNIFIYLLKEILKTEVFN